MCGSKTLPQRVENVADTRKGTTSSMFSAYVINIGRDGGLCQEIVSEGRAAEKPTVPCGSLELLLSRL